MISLFSCDFDFPRLVPVVVASRAARVGREREEPHKDPYSEGREFHPSTSFALDGVEARRVKMRIRLEAQPA